MIEHVVIIKFDKMTTREHKDNVIQQLRSLVNSIPGIVDLRCNHNFSERNQGFDIGLTIRFESMEALKAYGPHPEHQKVISCMIEAGMTDIIIVDFEI
ncbi:MULTISPECIES: Dabb family protein [Bacillaceae]|uniref:Dabb family protein n=1 Tax=Bacillaceae TaxID=186817 RepID=UPI0004798744|nr:Dabb family protein [Bacillus sp. UNC41MFS5]